MQRVRNAVALSLVLGGGLRADIVPLQGVQRMEGMVQVIGALIDESDSFDLSAPDAIASWAPSPVSIEAAAERCRVTLQSTYASEIATASMSVATSTQVRSTGNNGHGGGPIGFFDYAQGFTLRFEITSPAWFRVEAVVRRFEPTGWGESDPVSVVFAREGDPAIVSLVISPEHNHYKEPAEFTVAQSRLLAVGVYSVEISGANSFGGTDYIAESSASFSLTQSGKKCACDWDESGIVESQDFFEFLADFFESEADYDGDGVTNSQDFFDFLGCFFAGC